MRSNQQNQGQQTIKPWSTEIISNYNNQTLNSPDLSALQGAHGWNHLNADHFSMSPPSPCLLLDRDKSPHSSLKQHHKPGIWDVIWFVQPREHKELPGVWVRPAVSQVKVPGVQNLGCRVRMRWSYTLSRNSAHRSSAGQFVEYCWMFGLEGNSKLPSFHTLPWAETPPTTPGCSSPAWNIPRGIHNLSGQSIPRISSYYPT